MSRLNELKKQYPELNMSVFDMMTRMDTSDSYKYLPLFCKIFGKKFSIKNYYDNGDEKKMKEEYNQSLKLKGFKTDNLTPNQMFSLSYLTDFYPDNIFEVLREFMEYVDNGLVENKDITSYKNIDDIRGAISLATMKELTKGLEGQVIKEYEDDSWVIVRPLTFSASLKYGAGTKWCTTFKKEKSYFEKYWRRGILVYFLNKKTGYKFAGYKSLVGDNDFNFWSSEDNRIDYLELEVDDYLLPVVREIFKSDSTNKNLCSDDIQTQVHKECLNQYEKIEISQTERLISIENLTPTPEVMDRLRHRIVQQLEEIDEEDIPTMRA